MPCFFWMSIFRHQLFWGWTAGYQGFDHLPLHDWLPQESKIPSDSGVPHELPGSLNYLPRCFMEIAWKQGAHQRSSQDQTHMQHAHVVVKCIYSLCKYITLVSISTCIMYWKKLFAASFQYTNTTSLYSTSTRGYERPTKAYTSPWPHRYHHPAVLEERREGVLPVFGSGNGGVAILIGEMMVKWWWNNAEMMVKWW